MSKEAVLTLRNLSPMLKAWIEPQISDAILRDYTEFRDEPHAMIAVFIMEQSIEGFACAMFDIATEEIYSEVARVLSGEVFQHEWA
jgi:hypothetical protein